MGGSVDVRSELGVGSTFGITLPVPDRTAVRTAEEQALPVGGDRRYFGSGSSL
jgi:hypothetical protein